MPRIAYSSMCAVQCATSTWYLVCFFLSPSSEHVWISGFTHPMLSLATRGAPNFYTLGWFTYGTCIHLFVAARTMCWLGSREHIKPKNRLAKSNSPLAWNVQVHKRRSWPVPFFEPRLSTRLKNMPLWLTYGYKRHQRLCWGTRCLLISTYRLVRFKNTSLSEFWDARA